MALTAQTDQQKAGVGLTKEKFTTVGGVDIYMTRDGENFKGQGPGNPNNDLILDATTPFKAGSKWTNITDGKVYRKTITDSSSWLAETLTAE